MKTSTKSTGFSELNNALKSLKRGQQSSQKASHQSSQNPLFLRSSSQASNILLQAASSSNANIDIFSQRNSNANLKLSLNATSKLQKRSSNENIKRSSIDHSRLKQSPLISSPRVIESSEISNLNNTTNNGCQTSGRKSQYLNNSNLSGNSTSVIGNTKQIVGQIKISLAKSKSKTNINQQPSSQADQQQGGGLTQSDQNQSQKTLSMKQQDQFKLSRTQSRAKILSPSKQIHMDITQTSNKKASGHKQTKNRVTLLSQESDRFTANNVSEDEEFTHFNNKENFHSNIQYLNNIKKSNTQQLKQQDQQKRSQDLLSSINNNSRKDSQKFTNSISQALLKKQSDGQIDSKVLFQNGLNSNCGGNEISSNQVKNNSIPLQNSILNIIGRAKSQDKIQFENNLEQNDNQQQQQMVVVDQQQNNLMNSNSSQSQSSIAMMMMILASSGSGQNASTSNQNTSLNKSLKKSNSKSSLNSHKTLPQQGSKGTSSQTRLQSTTQNLNNQVGHTSHKQNNSISYLKTNCSNSGNLSKSNTSLLKNNPLSFSRGNLETLTDNTNILLTEHSFSNNNNYSQIINSKNQQNIIQSLQPNQIIPTNSFYRIASSSSISGKNAQTPLRETGDHNIACFQDGITSNMLSQQQNYNQQPQQYVNTQQLLQANLDQGKKLSVDEYRKSTCLQNNQSRNSEVFLKQQTINYLNTTAGLSNINGNSTILGNNLSQSNHNIQQQNTSSNYNQILNTQSDVQDGGSFFKYPSNYNFLLDCKTDNSSSGKLGCSSTQKRITNSTSNRLNTPQHPSSNFVLPSSQQTYTYQPQPLNSQQTPQRNDSVPYTYNEKQFTNSSFSSSQQSGLPQTQQPLITSNQNFSNANNHQNILVSQYVQNYNAIREITQPTETNFTFQNNSQNPSSFVHGQQTQQDYELQDQLQEEDLTYSKGKSITNIHQNQQVQLDKYATSSFQAKVISEEQLLSESYQRRCSQQIQQQQQQQANGTNLPNQNQKPFSVLFNNLFSSKGSTTKKSKEDLKMNKSVNQVKRKNSNSLVSHNTNLINLTNNFGIGTNPKTESSPPDTKQQDGNTDTTNQGQANQNYINSLIAQRNSQGFLPQEVSDKFKYKRTPSLTQFNYTNQYNLQLVKPLSNKNAGQENQNINLFNSNKANKQASPDLANDIDKELDQYKMPVQRVPSQSQMRRSEDENQASTQIQQNNQNLQNQMSILYTKMKSKLTQFKTSEQQWKNEKTQLLHQVESLQNQVNFLTEENSIFKKSVASFHNQNERQYQHSATSSMENMLQNF